MEQEQVKVFEGQQSLCSDTQGVRMVGSLRPEIDPTSWIASREWQEASRDRIDNSKNIIPELNLSDPWSQTSLNTAEQRFLARLNETLANDDDLIEDYILFLGEGLVRRFQGVWVLIPKRDLYDLDTSEGEHLLGIYYPDSHSDHIDVVETLPSLARQLGSGTLWASTFEGTAAIIESHHRK